MNANELSRLNVRIKAHERRISQLETQLSTATGKNKEKVANTLGEFKTRLAEMKEKYRLGKIAGQEKEEGYKQEKLKKENKALEEQKGTIKKEIARKKDIRDKRVEDEGTLNIREDGILEVIKDGQWALFTGEYNGKSYEDGKTGVFSSNEKRVEASEQEQSVEQELSKDAAVDFEGNTLQDGTTSEDGSKYVKDGVWKSKIESGDEDQGTFNITNSGLLEVMENGEWKLFTGNYQGKDYTNGVAVKGDERVGPSEEFGTEEVERQKGISSELEAEQDRIIAQIYQLIGGFDTANTIEELDALRDAALGKLAGLRG